MSDVLTQALTPDPTAQLFKGAAQPRSADDYTTRLTSNYERNKGYAKKGDYQTTLSPEDETSFRAWIKENNVPFDPMSKLADYDMRGFWQALQRNDPKATTGINPNDKQLHYPDYWKTPYHQTFSSESQWASEGAPSWNDLDQLVLPSGEIVYDERAVEKK